MLRKLSQRLSDPVFYRKRVRGLTRPFRHARIAPEPLAFAGFDTPGEVALVVAHPDDELFCAGLLAGLAGRGARVRALCLTRGEGGPLGHLADRGELGAVREAEMRASCAALGVDSVEFLGHVDPLGREFRTYAPPVGKDALAEQLLGLWRADPPGLVVTHGGGGEYWHPAHLLVHAAVRRALPALASETGKPVILATMNAWQEGHAFPTFQNRDDLPDLLVDAVPFRGPRLEALRAHASQAGFFAGVAGGDSADRFVERTPREAYALKSFTPPPTPA
ncbi:MAG: PIG-L family deacetylase [Verrucomicrobiae bacterium]|nr:PIG-L family deacetylase [Verrucomicrobiae bacterium]MCP5538608.1 PIG-L family deacetylase [Akkermansiaceae bacterium]MCP5550929.1 PIG-L family deacetylase [Akkermansiaceae bacterium]